MNDRAERLTKFDRDIYFPNLRPKDAATLIIIRMIRGKPHVLMGKRHSGHKFLPGKFVFPGGRVDPADSRLKTCDELPQIIRNQLLVDMKGRASPARARALALAALRETFEETGILIGQKSLSTTKTRSMAWKAFFSYGVVPQLRKLNFVARAITPPNRSRRYDTRFFCVSADEIAHEISAQDNELSDVHWLTFNKTSALDLPLITRVVLEDLQEKLGSDGTIDSKSPVPFYYMRNGRFQRDIITATMST